MDSTRPEAAVNFIRALHRDTTGPVAFQTLPGADELTTRNAADIERFVRRAARGEMDAYHCPVALRAEADVAPGETILRSKRNAAEAPCAWADIDAKDITISLEDAAKVLRALRFPPSFIVWSGNGLHPYWFLSEPFDVAEERERFEGLLRRLVDRFGGDPAPAHVAALMRLPGTHNRKRGECKLVTYEGSGRRYHFEELEEWLDEQPVLIERKPTSRLGGGIEPESNPFLIAAREYGWKPTLDVDGELGRMAVGNIHHTCVRVSASLLRRGTPLEEVVARLLGEIARAKAEAGEAFQERREERRLRAMCRSWIVKHPVEHRKERKEERPVDEPGEVHEYEGSAARAKKKAKAEPPVDDKAAVPSMVADGVIEELRQDGMDLMLADGEMWVYRDGVWSTAESGHEQRLRTSIQTGCDFHKKSHDSKVANAAWKRLNEHPGLYRAAVPWLNGASVATANGLLNVLTQEFTPHRPDAYARRKIGVAYAAGAQCPTFLGILNTSFRDREPDIREKAISLIQEWFGSMFAVSMLYREERKALILLGDSRTGKTELARIARRLVGEPVAAPAITEISERFGLMSFYGAVAWIRDDAINPGDTLDPQRWKTIITGEPIDIERKGLPPARNISLNIPVLLTANALPKARDASDAIFNRSIVLNMLSVMSESEARSERIRLGVPRGMGLDEWVFGIEGPGILNWALEGLARLLERGEYDPPQFVKDALQSFKDDNNPVGEFARGCLIKAPGYMIARHDLACAYHGWLKEQDGEDARAVGNRWLVPRVRSSIPSMEDHTNNEGIRFLVGIKLSDEGLGLWERHKDNPLPKGSKGFSLGKDMVNRQDPWGRGRADAYDDDAY